MILLALVVPAYLGADIQAIEDVFGKSDTYVLMVPRGNTAQERELPDALKELPQVSGILSYVDNADSVIPTEYVESDMLSKLVSEHCSRLVLSVKADLEGDAAFDLVARVREIAEGYSIAAVFIVLLFSFKSISLPVILVLAIKSGIWINTAIPYFTGQSVFYISYLIITSIRLGATVDYAILFTDRYTEFRRSLPKKEAVVQTVSSVTVSILTSGLALTVVGFLLGYISTHGLLRQMGFFLGRGALPGMLYLLDGLIERITKGVAFIKANRKGE